MNRRDFFKSILGAAALFALPSWLHRRHSDDFTVEFQAYKDPFGSLSNHVSDIRSYFRMPLDIDSIEPINIPFRSDGEWHMYHLTRQSGEMTWYVDGEKV